MAQGKVTDVIAPGLRVLFCGINPGLYSAQVGRHFARPGNRFWKALHRSGFTETLYDSTMQGCLLERGCGITNLVARETASADQLEVVELRAGGRALERKVGRYRPAWVAVLGVTAYRAAFADPGARVGPQHRRLAGAGVWVLPNPSGLNAHYQVEDLAREFSALREEGNPMIRGSCLCGGVRFELDRTVGPFELCHCNRCRKTTGSAFMAAVGVRREDFRWVQGRELIRIYDAPILESPPAYRSCFCERCGSPVPDPTNDSEWFEIQAGVLEGDPALRPDKHIFVELRSPWFEITDDLPQLDKQALIRLRTAAHGS